MKTKANQTTSTFAAVGNLRARRRFEDNADGTSRRAQMDRDFNGRVR